MRRGSLGTRKRLVCKRKRRKRKKEEQQEELGWWEEQDWRGPHDGGRLLANNGVVAELQQEGQQETSGQTSWQLQEVSSSCESLGQKEKQKEGQQESSGEWQLQVSSGSSSPLFESEQPEQQEGKEEQHEGEEEEQEPLTPLGEPCPSISQSLHRGAELRRRRGGPTLSLEL